MRLTFEIVIYYPIIDGWAPRYLSLPAQDSPCTLDESTMVTGKTVSQPGASWAIDKNGRSLLTPRDSPKLEHLSSCDQSQQWLFDRTWAQKGERPASMPSPFLCLLRFVACKAAESAQYIKPLTHSASITVIRL